MARYFNLTSGSVAITLKSSGSVYIPAKSWMTLPSEDEGSADLLRCLKMGYLARFEDLASDKTTSGTSQEGN